MARSVVSDARVLFGVGNASAGCSLAGGGEDGSGVGPSAQTAPLTPKGAGHSGGERQPSGPPGRGSTSTS